MTTTAKISSKYATICTVGYQGSVSRLENRSAHGAVCHIQVRRANGRMLARKVNANGRHQEVGESFEPTAEQVAHWESVAKASR
jgi:hypothetical protein